MDLATENRIAAMLMKEAAELRRQADREGSLAYLQKPQARGRPNSRFLTATVLGVQQANRSVEVHEMWQVRQKELELDERIKRKYGDESSNHRTHRDNTDSYRGRSKSHSRTGGCNSSSFSTTNRTSDKSCSMEDGGLKDEDIELFLQSRVKRGRGAVGSRIDETGPYFPRDLQETQSTSPNVRPEKESKRPVLGPEKPFKLNNYKSSEDSDEDRWEKKSKRGRSKSRSSAKEESDKHKLKKSKKRKKGEEKRHKRCK